MPTRGFSRFQIQVMRAPVLDIKVPPKGFLAILQLLSLQPGLRTVAAALGIGPEELEGFQQILAESSGGSFRLKGLLRSLVLAKWDKH